MPEILSYGFMQRALAAGAVVGVVAPMMGVFLVLRRLSLIADTLSHTALAGIALALLLGADPLWGALGAALLAAGGIERLRARRQIPGEAALAVFLSGGYAVAVVLLSLGRGFSPDLFVYLFGALTAVQPRDLWLLVPLGGIVAGTVGTLYKELLAITLDEEASRTQGIAVDALNLLFTLLVAVTVVAATRVVGILLTGALLVLPSLSAIQVARSFRGMLGLAVLFGLLSVLVGLTASFYLNIAPSGAVVLTALAVFAGSTLRIRG
ncbi:MAG: metal ABC transporter permease [Armatimonadetes bacterium]|nr:metal ABC transporter permease [Armatimonadota bacterium]MDW8154275.1 metal ABC transporter permease [Armatimonadota bacterium]